MRWKKVALVGVGLLGGSLGLALKERGLADRITGFVRRRSTGREALKAGAVDSATFDVGEVVEGADLVVFCTPLSKMASLMTEALPFISPGTLVTDVGSSKASVVHDLERLARRSDVHFIGSHPIAGGERGGVSAARSDLFLNKVCVVTPTKRSHSPALRSIKGLWKSVGCRVLECSPRDHDTLLGRSSHLPQLIASCLTRCVLSRPLPRQGEFCGTGFRDTTRVASSSPEMWRDIALANRTNLLQALADFFRELDVARRTLARAHPDELLHFFSRAKNLRDAWLAGQTRPPRRRTAAPRPGLSGVRRSPQSKSTKALTVPANASS